MFFQEDIPTIKELYDSARQFYRQRNTLSKNPGLNNASAYVEKMLFYKSDHDCPECGQKTDTSTKECWHCGLQVTICPKCNFKSYVVYLACCIRPECGNTHL